jgi:hypothetical protein
MTLIAPQHCQTKENANHLTARVKGERIIKVHETQKKEVKKQCP